MLRDKLFAYLGVQPGSTSGQATEPTAGDEVGITPTPTISDNLPPTETPTATGTVTATPSLPPGLAGVAQVRLGGLTEWIAASQPFTLTWGIDGVSTLPLGLTLVLTLPDGFTPIGALAGSWIAGTHKLTLSLAALGG